MGLVWSDGVRRRVDRRRRLRADASDRFVTNALLDLFGKDTLRLLVSADGSIFVDGLIGDNTNGIVDQPRLPRFEGSSRAEGG
jgi:hypothetical protein